MKLSRVGKIRSEISNNRKGSINLHRLDFSKPTANLASPFFPHSRWYKPRVQCTCPVWALKPSLPFPRLLWHQLKPFSELVISLLTSNSNASVSSTSSWFFYPPMSSVSRLLYPISINRFNADKLGLSTWLSFFIYNYLFFNGVLQLCGWYVIVFFDPRLLVTL